MNRREMLAGAVGAAGCAMLPATKAAGEPIQIWGFSEVREIFFRYHPSSNGPCRFFLALTNNRAVEVDGETFDRYAEWAKAPRKKDEYFVDIAHLNAVHDE